VELEAETHPDGDSDVNETFERPIDEERQMDTRLAATVPFMTFVLPMTVATFDTCRLSGCSCSPPPRGLPGRILSKVQTTSGTASLGC
jgi:hypothetical protein